jgi:hypothetical protein
VLKAKPLILAIDDEQFYLDEIKYEFANKNVDLITFLGPNVFEEQVKKTDIERSQLILVDYAFATVTAADRLIATHIRSSAFKFTGKIVLVSLLDDFGDDNEIIKKEYDGIIRKEDFCWEEIEKYLS